MDIKKITKSGYYPENLRAMENAPETLYVAGYLPTSPTVYITGARFASEYGRYMTKQLASTIAAAGWNVINGMNIGIEGIALREAMKVGGKTFAVFGCGVDTCYPPENRIIYDEILNGNGGIISCHEEGTQPAREHFRLNRHIAAGIADAVIIVEARRKAGCLVAVDAAKECGIPVFAIPGRVTDRLSDGANELLKNGDARMILSAEDFLEAMPFEEVN